MDQIMVVIKSFLESSTIHGLTYISSSTKLIRLFWTLVVIAGFTGAAVMIYQAFEDWNENPVTTTIETRPITEIILPKVTVCPPMNTFTDLNYVLKMSKNMTIADDTRADLKIFAIELLLDDLVEDFMKNMSLLELQSELDRESDTTGNKNNDNCNTTKHHMKTTKAMT